MVDALRLHDLECARVLMHHVADRLVGGDCAGWFADLDPPHLRSVFEVPPAERPGALECVLVEKRLQLVVADHNKGFSCRERVEGREDLGVSKPGSHVANVEDPGRTCPTTTCVSHDWSSQFRV